MGAAVFADSVPFRWEPGVVRVHPRFDRDDAAEAQLDIARDTLSGADNVTLVHGDAAQTALPVPAYDVIIACWMLGTVTGEQKRLDIINRMKSCLKPGGRMMLVENDSSGEFEEIRGKIPVSSAYNQWLQDKAGFSVAERLESCFRFENADDARAVIGAIWGEQVGQKVAGQFIKHNILIFDYSF